MKWPPAVKANHVIAKFILISRKIDMKKQNLPTTHAINYNKTSDNKHPRGEVIVLK